MGPSFDDDRRALAYIRADLGKELPTEISTALAEQLVIRCGMPGAVDDWPESSLDTRRAVVGAPFFGPWTVREDELADVKELFAGVLGAYGSPAGVHPLVSLLLSAGCMVWRLRRRGVSVTPLQRDVLLVLRANDALDIGDLVERAASLGTPWSRAEVEGTLAELSSMRLNNGSVVALVHRDSDGQWSTDARGLWEVPFGSVG